MGPERVLLPAQYEGFDVETKAECICALIPLGPMHLHDLLEEEVGRLAGTRYARKASQLLGQQHGTNPGSVQVAGQRHTLRIPRVQLVAGSEIPLQTLDHLRSRGALDEVLLKRLLYEIPCRNYEAAAVP